MKALSIQQPWADLILYHGKDVENRSWRMPPWMAGERIYIHAGLRVDRDAPRFGHLDYPPGSPRLGAILGEVTLVECVTESESLWFLGHYGFVLKDPEAYAEPIPCRGRLKFFTPDLPKRKSAP